MGVSNCVVVFVFVKQKTAYELRISDWSSDVCSSDLRLVEVAAEAAHGDALRFAPRARALDRHARQALQRRRDVRIGKLADILRRDRVDHAGGIALDVEIALQRAADAGDDEIGRASCRERVGQYV